MAKKASRVTKNRGLSKEKNLSSSKNKKISMTKKVNFENNDGIDQYVHLDKKRAYNPPVGLVTPDTDKDMAKKSYSYDPHLDPQLQWSGKAERTSFEVDTVSLHVHERVDPLTIIENVIKEDQEPIQMTLFHYFENPEQNPPLREAIQFYKHNQNWSNRLIAGDSLLVMNSLLQKEGMTGKVQMIYIDPPYGVNYGSNFQPFVNRREVKDGNDEDLTQEPEMVRAFRDTWELGIHSYLTYLRDRLKLAKELLTESGSIFVQIGEENVHLIRNLMDEIFKSENFISQISVFKTTTPRSLIDNNLFYVIWYAKDKTKIKYRQIYVEKPLEQWTRETKGGSWGVTIDNHDRPLTPEEKSNPSLLPPKAEVYQLSGITSSGKSSENPPFVYLNKTYYPGERNHWKTGVDGLKHLGELKRLEVREDKPWFKKYHKDFPLKRLTNVWTDTSGKATERLYVVQTQDKVIERCVLMSTDPGDLTLDPTCGSGTTAYASEKWGRRWITGDTSRVAISLAKQRLITSIFDYYELSHPDEGVSSGFKYKTIPHVTLGSLANNEPSKEEILYDKPLLDKNKKRVAGPFTIEAVPSTGVISLDETESISQEPDNSVARSGETVRMNDWVDELQITGIRGKSGQKIEFARIEPLGGTRHLHAEGETKESEPKKIVVSFGPAYAPLEQRQVELAIEEAQKLVPRPKIIAFASFQFDPEAAKDIDELDWPGVTILKVQMNTDLLTADLKKKRSSNESFWLVGQPDIEIKKKGEKHIVEVNGFDYYNPKTGEIESGDVSKISMWMLDTDYDGRSLYPRQIFFPMAGEKDGWGRLAKNLKSEIDEEVLDQLFKGNVSLPFSLGKNKRIAAKIIDDRGIESLKIIEVK